MTAHPSQPVLRLVNTDVAARPRVVLRGTTPGVSKKEDAPDAEIAARLIAEQRVAAENASASMSALDPRWVLAVAASRELQGGQAAVITPESRRRLLLVGKRLGLRPFDTNLVIAILQDGARAGEDPLGKPAVKRLDMVAPSRLEHALESSPGPTWPLLIACVIVAAATGVTATVAIMLWLARS